MLDTNENILVLYVGGSVRAAALQAATDHRGWYVRHAEDTMMALGIYIVEKPHIVVLEDHPAFPFVADVYMHLRSVAAAPLILLTDEPDTWARPADQSVYHLPTAVTGDSLAYAMTHITDTPELLYP